MTINRSKNKEKTQTNSYSNSEYFSSFEFYQNFEKKEIDMETMTH